MKNKEHFKILLHEEWEKIIPQAAKTFINSILCSLESVLKLKNQKDICNKLLFHVIFLSC